VIAEVEDEQENFLLHTHLFTPLALLREGGPSYSFDIDYRYNRTDEACLSTTSATAGTKTVVFSLFILKLIISPRRARDKHRQISQKDRCLADHCMARSIVDHLDYGMRSLFFKMRLVRTVSS
jgi:hypothetical protein